MSGLREHFVLQLRLHLRNRMAMAYGCLFPLIYLAVFWVLYRHEKIPLVRHAGEWLTVAVLGGASLGLPTTLVGERERGVWRRFRLAPVALWRVVAATVAARYVIILGAGVLQLVVALAVGMTLPAHPLSLWLALSVVTLAFIGLGLMIAALADTVPAVQGIGQCVFLPMLVVGGVAVPVAALPEWAQHVSAFLPGRYAVAALQECVTGAGLSAVRFDLVALVVIGLAAGAAGAKLFRWDSSQRFLALRGKAWLVPALAAWLAVGLWAELRYRVLPPAPPAAAVPAPPPQPPWMRLTEADIAALDFRVPSDGGVVSPMAAPDDPPDENIAWLLDEVATALPTWAPGRVADDAQAVRNLLSVCAVPDVVQLSGERYLPFVVLDYLSERYPKDQLVKLLAWVALHPEEGDVVLGLPELGIPGTVGDPWQVRERTYLYALKFIMRLTDRKPPGR